MLTSLSMTICLLAASAQPLQPGSPSDAPAAPAAQATSPPSANQPLGSFGPHAYSAEHCDQCTQRHHRPTPFHDWTCPPCNLALRYPYYPKDHGHYYFRPYHMQRVQEHQALAVTWGEDPRNPHGQLVFERVYDQLRAEQAAKAEPLPVPESKPNGAKTNGTKPRSQNGVTPMPLPMKPEAEPNPTPPQPAPEDDDARKNDQGRRPIVILR